jgi:hypothetical protein
MVVMLWMLDHPLIGLIALFALISGPFSIGTFARKQRDIRAFTLTQSPSFGPAERLDARGVALHLVFLISYALGGVIFLFGLPLMYTLILLLGGGIHPAP